MSSSSGQNPPRNAGRPPRGRGRVAEGTGGGRGGHQRDRGGDPRHSPGSHNQGHTERRDPPKMMKPPIVDTGGAEGAAGPSGNECVVCCREISIYAVGPCDHTVCYVCSTRLRVLCKTKECPVCRATVEEVYFIKEHTPFAELKRKNFNLQEEEFAIFFEDADVRLDYDKLLEHKCKECERRALIAARSGERPPAIEAHETFDDLAEHVESEHRRLFCSLCVKHLNLFTFERQAYSKTDLRRHMTEGDLDDKSHKGHPRCDFCKDHYLDKDELYRHLKMEHFSCFICAAANTANRVLPYYNTYENLRQHFMKEHFLCEQGDCATTRFVAFKSDLEYKAHCASAHSDHLSREEQRAARNVNLDFGTLPHDRQLIGADGRSGGRRLPREGGGRGRDYRDDRRRREPSPGADSAAPARERPVDEWGRETFDIDMASTTDFPSLEGAPRNISRPLVPTPQYGRKMNVNRTVEEFPSLGPSPAADPPLAVPMRRPTPNFKNAISSNAASTSSSLSSMFAATSKKRSSVRSAQPVADQMPSAAQVYPQITPKVTVSTNPAPERRPTTVANTNGGGELFPSLPEPVADMTFGNVLKPLPPKKANGGRNQTRKGGRSGAENNSSVGGSSGWAAIAGGGITINKKSNANNSGGKKNKKKGTTPADSTTSMAAPSGEVNGNSAQTTGGLVDLRSILPSLSEVTQDQNNRQCSTDTKERIHENSAKGGENFDDFDLNVCGASWGSTPVSKNKKSSTQNEKKAPKQPTLPKGLRKDEDFPSLGPAQRRDESLIHTVQLKPKYKGLKPGEAIAEMKKADRGFIQPPQYTKRNNEFMGMLKLLLDGSTGQVFEYRTLLASLRNDQITAEEFVQQCLQIFPDPSEFTKVFPDLVCLLPDIGKQNELVPIYDELRIRFGGSRSDRANKSSEPWVRCSECGQITAPEDAQPHLRAH